MKKEIATPRQTINLHALLRASVRKIGTEPPVGNLYNHHVVGTPICTSHDRIVNPNGMIIFGEQYDVRRIAFGMRHIIFAPAQNPDDSTLIIDTFGTHGLAVRTSFTQFGTEPVAKSQQTDDWAGLATSRRLLSPAEEYKLAACTPNPMEFGDYLYELTQLDHLPARTDV